MPETPMEEFLSVCETWQHRRVSEARQFKLSGLRAFCELMNFETRKLISLTGKSDPNFWSAVAELATNAQTLTTRGAKLFAEHQDRTDV